MSWPKDLPIPTRTRMPPWRSSAERTRFPPWRRWFWKKARLSATSRVRLESPPVRRIMRLPVPTGAHMQFNGSVGRPDRPSRCWLTRISRACGRSCVRDTISWLSCQPAAALTTTGSTWTVSHLRRNAARMLIRAAHLLRIPSEDRRACTPIRGRVVHPEPRVRGRIGLGCSERDLHGGTRLARCSGGRVIINDGGVRGGGTMAWRYPPVMAIHWTG